MFLCLCSGYMAPEYAMHGRFSVKTDVYSFGVLVLEIISGKRNSGLGFSEDTDLPTFVSDKKHTNKDKQNLKKVISSVIFVSNFFFFRLGKTGLKEHQCI